MTRTQGVFVAGGYGHDRGRRQAPLCSRRRARGPRMGALALLETDARDPAATLLQRREIPRGLRADQLPEPERLPGDRQLVARVVDDLQEEARRRPALVQLPRRVQVARAEAARDDAAGGIARTVGERLDSLLVRVGRLDERLDAD